MKEKREGIFKAFSEIIPESYRSSWTQSTKQKPSLDDFKKKRIATREDLVSQVIDQLKNRHFCIVAGRRDTGKTWLCYAIGFELIKKYKKNKDRDIWFTNANIEFTSDEAWHEITSKKVKRLERYIIIEDCHRNVEKIEELLDRINQEGEENLRFLFTLRKTGKLLLKDVDDTLYDFSEDKNCIVNLTSRKEHIKGIIKKFIEIEKVKLEEKELDFIAEKWHKDDLYLVRLRLKAWNFKEGQRIDEIKDDQVFNYIWSTGGEIKLGLSSRRNILLPLSALCQIEPLSMWSCFMLNFHIEETTLQQLRDEGIIESSSWRGADFFRISESEATLILKIASDHEGFDVQEYTEKQFKDYLECQPPNWAFMFSALYRAREKDHSVKDIAYSMLRDDEVWASLFRASEVYISQTILVEMYYALRFFSWADQMNKAKDFWLHYVLHKGQGQILSELVGAELSEIINFLRVMMDIDQGSAQRLAQDLASSSIDLKEIILRASVITQSKFYGLIDELNPALARLLLSDEELWKDLLDKLKMSTANMIRDKLLDPLSKVADLNQLFGEFSITDWVSVVDSSKLNTVRLLLAQDFVRWRIKVAEKSLARALPHANLRRLISDEQSSLFQLKGLLYTMEDVDAAEATRLVDKLGKLDLNALISRADAETTSWALLKVEQLSHSSALKIVKRVRAKSYVEIIEAAPLEQGFWLLWNIYRISPSMAKRVTKINAAQSLLADKVLNALSPSSLALLGLLQLCDFKTRNISIDNEENITGIALAVNEETSPTVQILSLVALKARLEQEKFQQLWTSLDEQSIKERVASQPDIQLIAPLENILADLLP